MTENSVKYQELKTQIAELKKENKALKHNISLQNKNKTEYDITSIIDCIGDPIFLKDHESRLILVNNAFCKMFKVSKTDTIGKTLAEKVTPEEREEFLKIDRDVIFSGIENLNEEKLTLSGHKTRIILTRKTRFINSDGHKFIIGVIHDITDIHNAKNALKKSEQELTNLNKTKDRLFSIIAHDLRSPFNNIIGLHDLILENSKKFSEDTKEYLSLIYSTAKSTNILLDNLLNWAKSQTEQINFYKEQINLVEISEEIIELGTILAKTKQITISHTFSKDIIVNADRNMLMVILRNLLCNAIKFTNHGGKIKLTANIEQNSVKFTISDNGIGIEKEKLQDLFTSLSTNVSHSIKYKNHSGLGLLLCKEFVELHNGKIWAESEINKGSNFYFTLPL